MTKAERLKKEMAEPRLEGLPKDDALLAAGLKRLCAAVLVQSVVDFANDTHAVKPHVIRANRSKLKTAKPDTRYQYNRKVKEARLSLRVNRLFLSEGSGFHALYGIPASLTRRLLDVENKPALEKIRRAYGSQKVNRGCTVPAFLVGNQSALLVN